MKGPMHNRFITLIFLCISRPVLVMIGLTLSSLLTQASSEWEWGNIAAFTGSLALCLMLFPLFRAHTRGLTEVAQRSQVLAEKIAEHQRAEEMLAERMAQLEAVRDVAVEITRELDPTALLGLITRRAAELVGTQFGVVYLWNEASQTLIPRAWHGIEEWIREVRLGLGEGIAGTVAQRREGMIVENYYNPPSVHHALAERRGPWNILAEPLLYRDRLVGVIVLLNSYGVSKAFTGQGRNLLTLFAAQAAIAIQSAQLYEALGARARRLDTLTRLNQLISASLDMDDVLHEITMAAATLMDTPLVRIWIADEQTQTLELRAASNERLSAHYDLRTMRFGERSAGWVAKYRQILHIPDVFNDERSPTHSWFQANGLRSSLGVPIFHRDTLLGVLILFGRKPFQLGSDDQALLDSFAKTRRRSPSRERHARNTPPRCGAGHREEGYPCVFRTWRVRLWGLPERWRLCVSIGRPSGAPAWGRRLR